MICARISTELGNENEYRVPVPHSLDFFLRNAIIQLAEGYTEVRWCLAAADSQALIDRQAWLFSGHISLTFART